MKLFNDVTPLRLPLLRFKGELEFRVEDKVDEKSDKVRNDSSLNSRVNRNQKEIGKPSEVIRDTRPSSDSFDLSNENLLFSKQEFESKITKNNKKSNSSKEGKGVSKASKFIRVSINHQACRTCKHNNFNNGRWTEEEHRRFIEAILSFGNEWRSVQLHIKTRSSTQSRSHSQKFFLKMRNISKLSLSKFSISSLYLHAKSMSDNEREDLISLLISYEFDSILPGSAASNNAEESVALAKKRIKCNKEKTQEKANIPIFKTTKENSAHLQKAPIYSFLTLVENSDISKPLSSKEESLDEFSKTFLNVFSSGHSKLLNFDSQAVIIQEEDDDFIYNTHYLSSDRSSQKFESNDMMIDVPLYIQ